VCLDGVYAFDYGSDLRSCAICRRPGVLLSIESSRVTCV
jgi:hypothetical protein